MSLERSLTVLLSPRVTEKASLGGGAYAQYVFEVAKDATKAQIKNAVEKLFEVSVRSVSVCNVKGKMKRRGSSVGRQKNWKKAYVLLEQGHELDISRA